MSHRASKRLRRDMRANTVHNPSDCAHVAGAQNWRKVPAAGELNADGTTVPRFTTFVYTGAVTLDRHCGRSIYQGVKRGRP